LVVQFVATVLRYVLKEYEPAGKVVFAVGSLGPGSTVPDAPPDGVLPDP